MKFKKYVKESFESALIENELVESCTEEEVLDESLNDKLVIPFIKKYGVSITTQQMWEDELVQIANELAYEQTDERAATKLRAREEALRNMFDAQREFEKAHNVNESINDMSRRCEKCNTLLNDGGTCPKCDDGEEDYGDEKCEEALTEEACTEELSVREKLKAAYPELNFDNPPVVTEELTNKEKLMKAFPGEFNFDTETTVTEELDDYADYDDDYEIEDDVELDRRHAALYGGDRMYCDCGHKLAYNDYGSYCPVCEPQDPEDKYEAVEVDDCYDDEI